MGQGRASLNEPGPNHSGVRDGGPWQGCSRVFVRSSCPRLRHTSAALVNFQNKTTLFCQFFIFSEAVKKQQDKSHKSDVRTSNTEVAGCHTLPPTRSPPSLLPLRVVLLPLRVVLDIAQEALASLLNTHLEGDDFLGHLLPLDPNCGDFFDKFRDGILMCRLVCLALPGSIGDRSAYRRCRLVVCSLLSLDRFFL